MNDVEWDIFMLEIEVRNEALIREMMIAKMRHRDLEQMIIGEEQVVEEPLGEEVF